MTTRPPRRRLDQPDPWRPRLLRWLRMGAWTAAILIPLAAICWFLMIRMPGETHRGPLPPLSASGADLAKALRADVETLASRIGERNVWNPAGLAAAADHIQGAFQGAGLAVSRLRCDADGHPCENLEGVLQGTSRRDEIVVVGAHYDSVRETVGANDNASGVAGLLALARRFAGRAAPRTIRFVAFANEEPPWFQTDSMGSLIYARACRQRGDQITAMLSLETIGFYSDAAGSQDYPMPFGLCYPSQGNFVAFISNMKSGALVREALAAFRATTPFPSEGGAMPSWMPGIGWSDHWSFWVTGYRALMVTDTAPFRYAHYHTRLDTYDKIDYERMARVVAGVECVIRGLAGGTP